MEAVMIEQALTSDDPIVMLKLYIKQKLIESANLKDKPRQQQA